MEEDGERGWKIEPEINRPDRKTGRATNSQTENGKERETDNRKTENGRDGHRERMGVREI